MKPYFRIIIFVPAIFILFSLVCIAQEDASKVREIIAMNATLEKIEALHKIKNDYPQSQLLNRVNQELFLTYLNMNKADSAIHYADVYISALPASSRMNAYNGVAYNLAEMGVGLDSALLYADRALDMAKGNSRSLNNIRDTKAYVLYKNGDAKSALETQIEAMPGNEDHPEFLFHLALYQEATGSIEEAIKNAGLATLNGDPGEALAKINEWGKKVDGHVKSKIIMDIVNAYVHTSVSEDSLNFKSGAAAFMAQTEVNLPLANEWAEEAVKTIDNKTKVENYVSFKTNYAIVKTAEGKYKDALKELEEIRDLVDPWNGNYWLTLGKVYQNLNQKEKALDAYISGLIVMENPPVLEAARQITSDEQIEKGIENKKQEIASFKPGIFDKATKTTDKVVLAELFTGAECGPCAAADIAFDELAEYYPRNALAILEYHVHIPGPDPLTNPEGYQRYDWYGADFGTPTVFFEGNEKIQGGGPRIAASNRFNVYNHAIKKYINEKPEVKISGDAKFNGDKIDLNIAVKPGEMVNNIVKPILFIALVEKAVNYTGNNGIDKHIFVVRDLIDGPEGTEISLKEELSFKKIVDIKELEGVITNYLTDPTKDPSWRAPQFAGWRLNVEELNNIDEKNLSVVAWIQDEGTKEVLQAHYFDVK